MAKLTKKNFIDSLREMSLLEVKELVDGLKEEFGIDPNALFVSGSNQDNNKIQVEEKTEFSVIVKDFGDSSNKIPIIKTVKEITGFGLYDIQKLLNTPDAVIQEKISKEKAEEIKNKLELIGAVVEIQ
ncbi:50S ribosomal protein L7/L12 [Candidatus Phytoplasma mali]|uniref:Large ribosomal subunit protein bL12 n=1 Tax=Phytoplasma mali (strain AT) TaxID=482235 RepID=RL7_PHYMT|nr:50S ribosomal protein L7/L12 [Candidatus Phytoplasma mali]B3QZG9.1 RecName: Full=Large ribosomal subunit protein bL12; AltName: Full=50S ribosomal protein L7/L12 [Candidatus Phytoplasma mali AT]CAP18576.1 50S ribosomal protein L7/L12 [Candidatus Phytoplasma mali]